MKRASLDEDLHRNFGFILTDISKLLQTHFDRRVKSLGLTRSQWWVLNQLYRQQGVSQSQLADDLEIERPALGRLLDRLESKGWVSRQADVDDRRVNRVWLTEEVGSTMATMRRVAAELRADAVAGLNHEQQDEFVDLLLHIKSNLLGLASDSTEVPSISRTESANAPST